MKLKRGTPKTWQVCEVRMSIKLSQGRCFLGDASTQTPKRCTLKQTGTSFLGKSEQLHVHHQIWLVDLAPTCQHGLPKRQEQRRNMAKFRTWDPFLRKSCAWCLAMFGEQKFQEPIYCPRAGKFFCYDLAVRDLTAVDRVYAFNQTVLNQPTTQKPIGVLGASHLGVFGLNPEQDDVSNSPASPGWDSGRCSENLSSVHVRSLYDVRLEVCGVYTLTSPETTKQRPRGL